jgi:hypothetical protein
MVMHELFSLQIDIDALNPRSSLILPYFIFPKLGSWRISDSQDLPYTFLITFKLCGIYFPLPIFQIFLFGAHLDQRLRCSLPVINIVRVFLALSLAGIRVPFGILLLRHQTSARLPSDLFV